MASKTTNSYLRLLLFYGLALLVSQAAGQKIKLEQEYIVRPVLESVIINPKSPDLQPRYLIYAHELVTYPEQKRQPLKLAGLYANRSHTNFVLITTKVNNGATYNGSQPARRRVNLPFYAVADRWDYASYCRAQGNVLQFYNAQKQLVREVELDRTIEQVDLTPLGVFEKRGRYFLFYRPLAELERKKKFTDLFFFLGNGRQLWETQLPLDRVESIGIANNGRYLVIGGWLPPDSVGSSHEVTLLMDSTAQTLTTFPFSFTHYHFDTQNSYLALGDQYRLRLIALPRQQLLWQLELGSENLVITDCRLLGDKVLVALGRKGFIGKLPIYNDPEIVLFSLDGEKIDEVSLPMDYSVHGAIILEDSSARFGLVLQDRLAVFTITQ